MTQDKRTSLVSDLFPSISELKKFGKHLFSSKSEGPLARLGLELNDLDNMEVLPRIKRSRDFHVYSDRGIRYLDCHRGDGAALLGYSLPGFSQTVKNRIDQGIHHGFPHTQHKQLLVALDRYFPKHQALVCPDRYRIASILEVLNVRVDRPLLPLSEDLETHAENRNLHFWLPFSSSPGPLSIATLPSVGMQGPYILLVRKDILEHHLNALGNLRFDLDRLFEFICYQVPVWLVSAAIGSLSALESVGAFAGYVPGSGGVLSDPLNKKLSLHLGIWRESAWQGVRPGPAWKRIGPYLLHSMSSEQYKVFYRFALERRVVFNPRSRGINVLPGVMSAGEKNNLESVLSFVPGSGEK